MLMNIANDESASKLHVALRKLDVEEVRRLLAEGCVDFDAFWVEQGGPSPLLWSHGRSLQEGVVEQADAARLEQVLASAAEHEAPLLRHLRSDTAADFVSLLVEHHLDDELFAGHPDVLVETLVSIGWERKVRQEAEAEGLTEAAADFFRQLPRRRAAAEAEAHTATRKRAAPGL